MTKFTVMQPKHWVYVFIITHLFCWTFFPAMVRYNLPLDSIEGTIWGNHLDWGYDKNPFLNGWLTALAVYLSRSSDWIIYFFSQLSVVTAFWVVWRLGKLMLTPIHALIAVMLLEGIQYYNFHAIDFNDNTLELGLWALIIYAFYFALKSSSRISWLAVGLFAGLAMMAKYYTAALLAAMALFLICDAKHRKQLATLNPYLAFLVFTALCIPHVIWLYFHDFVTVNYVLKRADSVSHWTNHIAFPFYFALEQFEVFFPAVVLALPFLFGKRTPNHLKLASFDKQFLIWMGFGPLILTLLLSTLFGIKLRAGWGMPLLSLWTLALLVLAKPIITKKRLMIFIGFIYTTLLILISAYSYSLIDSKDPSSANFPGRELALETTKLWRNTYHTPLPYVAGSRWISGNISFYSADKPAVFVQWNTRQAPWIDLNDLQKKGAIFTWEISNDETLPDAIKQQYPQLKESEMFVFNWKRDKYHLSPIKIGVALLPPKESVSLTSK